MTAKYLICLGDKTDHGGTVIEVFEAPLTIDGKPVASVGSLVECPQCKGVFPIVAGDVAFSYLGKQVAVEDMQTACGAKLIASQKRARVGNG